MAVYFTLTWPLGTCFREGIPSSSRPEAGGARHMIPGDPLQMVYQLWMFADSFTGQTPFFHDVYEFNQGNDQARYRPGSCYFPFGLVYSAGYFLGGCAMGWNLMLCLTVWLIYLFTWLLLERFSVSWLTAGVAALPSILLPFFHGALLGGNPAGLGMLWVPLIFLGLDAAIRDRKAWGGVLAGILLVIAAWVDLHVFFFVFLAVPVWALMCMAFEAGRDSERTPGQPLSENTVTTSWGGGAMPHAGHGRKRRHGLRQDGFRTDFPHTPVLLGWFKPVVPVLLGMGLAYLQTGIIKSSLDRTLQSGGRAIQESLAVAPRWLGWLDITPDNRFNIVYIGVWVSVLLLSGLVLMMYDTWRRKSGAWIRLGLMAMVCAAIGGIAILALGPNTPFDHEHRLWQALRVFIPPFKMIRQPARIYCILAPFLGLALVLAMDRFNRSLPRRSWVILLAAVVAAGCLADYGRYLDPSICLLDDEQGAYRAVEEDAAGCGRENRALALPLWAGDSPWNSITAYYSSLYRTKMLNGYSLPVSHPYFRDVYRRYEAINMGVVTDEMLGGLLGMKIGYLVLHEDAFTLKASPFPVFQTLNELMRHPRLQFLANDKTVWAFKILEAGISNTVEAAAPEGTSQQEVVVPGGYYSAKPGPPIIAAWQWDACDMAGGTATVEKDGVMIFIRLADTAGTIHLDRRELYPVEGLRYAVAVSGNGSLAGSFGTDLSNDAFSVTVTGGNEWRWIEIPAPVLPPGRKTLLEPSFTNTSGRVDISMIVLMAGPWKWLHSGESLAIPAESFCTTGYTDTNQAGIHLDRDRTQAGAALYAPVVPVLPGRYYVTLDYTTAPPASGELSLGEFTVERSDGQNRVTLPVLAGREFVLNYTLESPRPLRLEFRFNRAADMVIHSVTLTRAE